MLVKVDGGIDLAVGNTGYTTSSPARVIVP
jgi:hypothetical protein